MTQWLVLDDEEVVHVIPESDTRPHGIRKGDEVSVEVADLNCPCKPKIDMSGNKVIVIHSSFEDMEKIEKALNNPHLSI